MNIKKKKAKTDTVGRNIVLSEASNRSDYFDKKEDAAIWQEFKSGSEAAFSHIYRSHFNKLFTYCLQFTKDQELVKDLIQDFFIDLRVKREKLGYTDNIRYYFFKSMRHKIARCLKKHRSIGLLNHASSMQHFQVVVSHETTLINQQLTEEKKEKLQLAFKRLTPKQREVIFYVYYENLPYKEVAYIMGLMNAKSARNLTYKAINSLKREMERNG